MPETTSDVTKQERDFYSGAAAFYLANHASRQGVRLKYSKVDWDTTIKKLRDHDCEAEGHASEKEMCPLSELNRAYKRVHCANELKRALALPSAAPVIRPVDDATGAEVVGMEQETASETVSSTNLDDLI